MAALFLTGCGSGGGDRAAPAPKLPAPLASSLSRQSDEVARLLDAGDPCGALASARRLQSAAVAAINARQVPAPLQEPLLAAANDLTARIRCTSRGSDEEDDEKSTEGKDGKRDDKGKHGKGRDK